jgi:hypothetical protein
MTRFVITFRPHIPEEQVSNLSGILGFKGLVRVELPNKAILDVSREVRVPGVVSILNQWDRLGWLEWSYSDKISN